MTTLAGQRVWLTGASMGIGRAVALELARRGAVPILTARSEEKLNDLRDEIVSAGGMAIVQPGDITNLDRMRAIVADVETNHGPIDILVANAGTHRETDPEAFDTDEYMELMNLNYAGMLKCIEAVLPGMITRRSGRLVGVSSLAGLRGMPSAAAYSASKGAVINFLQSLHFHLKAHNVAITIVTPGFVKTPLTDKNDFEMPFMIEAEKAARIICSGIERGKKQISFPFPFSTFIQIVRILPNSLYLWVMSRVWSRMNND